MSKKVKFKDVAPTIMQQYASAGFYAGMRQLGVFNNNTFQNGFIKSRFDKFHGVDNVTEDDREFRRRMTKLLIMLALAIAVLIFTLTWAFPKLDALMDQTEVIAAMTDSQAKAEALSAHIDKLYNVGIIGMAIMMVICGLIGFPSYINGLVEATETKIKRGTAFIKLAAVCLSLLIAAIIMKTLLL